MFATSTCVCSCGSPARLLRCRNAVLDRAPLRQAARVPVDHRPVPPSHVPHQVALRAAVREVLMRAGVSEQVRPDRRPLVAGLLGAAAQHLVDPVRGERPRLREASHNRPVAADSAYGLDARTLSHRLSACAVLLPNAT
jgi:hypothetical protein